MTAPPIIGGWFQALAIANRGCKSSIRKRITGYSMERLVFEREAATMFDTAAWLVYPSRAFVPRKVRAMVDFLRVRLAKG